jgi:hydroxymethylglutaryl-CoA synthase
MSRPENVGILAMEMYVPKRFVPLTDLEAADNCSGKYTVGLGQLNMAFVDDREDITSIFLTATHNLLEKYGIDPSMVGRLEVGTETLTDKSKSVKTSLLRLFGDNTDLEGVTNVNACYGGTAAVFNSVAWVESSEWTPSKPYALVVCGDIAVYEKGPARPTGGCGALAILIGPDAPLAMEPGVRASHALDVYDFYKPHHSEYAAVDGRLSQWAFLSSVDTCYQRYKAKHASKHPGAPPVALGHFDFFASHTPYNKLVQKGFARLLLCDYLAAPATAAADLQALAAFKDMPLADTYESKEVEAALKTVSAPYFQAKVDPSCKVNQHVGNCYTGSVFSSLLSVVVDQGAALEGKRVLLFSYGSGSVASMYSFVGRPPASSSGGSGGHAAFTCARIQATADMFTRLQQRTQCTFDEFSAALDLRAAKYGTAPMAPDGRTDLFFPGTYYLTGVNDKHHRNYARA